MNRYLVYVRTKRLDWDGHSRTGVMVAGGGPQDTTAIAYAETWQQAVDSVIGGLRRSEKILELRVSPVEDIREVPGDWVDWAERDIMLDTQEKS